MLRFDSSPSCFPLPFETRDPYLRPFLPCFLSCDIQHGLLGKSSKPRNPYAYQGKKIVALYCTLCVISFVLMSISCFNKWHQAGEQL